MALTRTFKETMLARAQRDPAFREALLKEGVEALLAGDVETGKAVLRDYINATIGFDRLGAATGTPPKSLMRMFGPRGNPNARNLFSVIGALQRTSGVDLRVEAAGSQP
ncbi:MAG: transcriptional regulator [Proteobacteria bacterium]|nr:transcriptional regulator [Pseudomonadota bacterium]MDA1072423.1 transcriptional regulator [Pseudomonadota bacterium]